MEGGRLMAGDPRPKAPVAAPAPRKRVRPVSPKRRRMPSDVVEEVHARSMGRCECSPECTDRAEVLHHVRRRSQGGGNGAGNLLALSDAAHRFIHANPEWAYEHGLLIRGVS